MMKLSKESFRRHRRAWFMALGSIFLFGTILVLLLFEGNSGLDILEDMLGGVEQQTDVVSEGNGSDPPAFDYWYAPPSSFGISESRSVNRTTFKNLLKDTFHYVARYKLNDIWHAGNQYLSIGKTWNETGGFWKLNFVVDIPVDIQGLDVTFWCNKSALEYVERDEFEIWFNVSANLTEQYSLMFNWSDLKDIGGLWFEKGVSDDKFYFRINRGATSSGHYEFDPTFGGTDANGWATGDGSANQYMGTKGIVADGSGIADNVTVYIPRDWDVGEEIKCALYNADGTFYNATKERTSGGDGFQVFNFSEPKPTVTHGTSYYVVRYIDDAVDYQYKFDITGRLYGTGVYPTWESPADTIDTVTIYYLYCSYTFTNYPPTIGGENPTNESYNESVGTVRVNVTITDIDGNSSTCDFYTSTDGSSWTWRQTNTSVLNESISYDYTTSVYQTIYYWRVTANDTYGDNTTSDIYNFETTPYRTLFFNDTYPNENWINSSNNMTHVSGWENFTDGDISTYYLDTGMTANTYDINLDMYDSTYDYGPSPRTVFIDGDTGYAVGVDHSGSDEPHMYKTTDGGETWTDTGDIDSATDPTDGWAGAIWYGQWTPGNTTGTKIYLAYIGDDADDLEFNWIDTSDDSHRGSWVAVHSWGAADGGDGSPAICLGTDDIIWIGGSGATTVEIYNSSDDGDTFVGSKPASLFDDDDDDIQLLPMADGDIICLYRDITTTDIGFFRYWRHNDTWSGFTVIASDASGQNCMFSATMDKDTGDIYMVYNTNDASATADINMYVYTVANNTWWKSATLETDAYGYQPGIVIHEDTNDLYCFYEDGSSGNMDIYYQKSTNGGTTWNSREQINTVTDDNRHCLGNFMSNERIYATWVNEDLNDWHGNTLATYALGKEDAWILSDEIFLPNDIYSWDKLYVHVNQTLSCSFALVDPDDNDHNITSGLTGDGDDISAVTNISVMIYGNFSDDSVNMASWNISWAISEEQPSIYVINGLCGTLNNITWVGTPDTIVWSNATGGCGGTLEYNMTINVSDNITNIYVYCDNLDATITADNIELYLSSDNVSFGSLDSFNSGGNNLTINKANWDDSLMSANLFNGTGLTDTIQSIFMRFKLTIPSGVSNGNYSQSDWKIRCFKTT